MPMLHMDVCLSDLMTAGSEKRLCLESNMETANDDLGNLFKVFQHLSQTQMFDIVTSQHFQGLLQTVSITHDRMVNQANWLMDIRLGKLMRLIDKEAGTTNGVPEPGKGPLTKSYRGGGHGGGKDATTGNKGVAPVVRAGLPPWSAHDSSAEDVDGDPSQPNHFPPARVWGRWAPQPFSAHQGLKHVWGRRCNFLPRERGWEKQGAPPQPFSAHQCLRQVWGRCCNVPLRGRG